ncbi:MAG: SH3 domain-containing protein [Chloroflexota bacterium]
MRFETRKFYLWTALVVGLVLMIASAAPGTKVLAQQPTGSVPTVTGTPTGPIVKVTYSEQINVRSGPSSYFYPIIGILLPNQTAPALGRSPGGDWIMIAYPGVPGGVAWVYAPLVSLSPGTLPIIEPPPTPTPRTTATLDPTLAAAYETPLVPTRLPTFTPPAPLVIPTYTDAVSASDASRIPTGLLIVALGLVGLFGALISFLRGR